MDNVKFKFKIGHGYDVHRLTADRKLIVGGIHIPYHLGLLGHSDADVLLHAVTDAVLGALGLGDIGGHFPDTNPSYKDADSSILAKEVYHLLINNNFSVENIDATIIAQAPKFAPYIISMKNNIAGIFNISSSDVNIKATTEEGLGFTGSGEAIAAHAVVLIKSLTGRI